ncbi:MAG: RtcB family protein [Nanoarchaeota archaeon]|nr:RtcB family protein [Nanoarchaeota archaeon]
MGIKDRLKKVGDCVYELAKEDNMNVPARFFLSEKLFEGVEDDAILQCKNVACLPGIYTASMAMPDMHVGYGFPIGGVAAFDAETGVISPGGVGFDINCGVRLLTTNLKKKDVEPKIKELLDTMFRNIPCGVGGESRLRLNDEELDDVLNTGAAWAVKNNLGNQDDLEHCEGSGSIKLADAKEVSQRAKSRGRKQLGTLGAGNHFLEIQVVDEIYDEKIGKAFKLEGKDQVTVMIHCGSRGLGHQVCSDYIRKMEDAFPDIRNSLPEKDLIYAPANSDLAKQYFKAMSAAANYAWANRHIIAHQVRKSFRQVFGDNVELKTVYDVAHNIAKLEEYEFDGNKRKVYVHRKGATRAFGPGSDDIPADYKDIGQPIILPGSMGTSSYLLVGTQKAMDETFGSTAHGAGRVMSRMAAKQKFRADDVTRDLEKLKIYVKAASWKGISEEAPQVYKDVDEVVSVSNRMGIGNIVAKVKPLGVIKG